MNSDENDLKSCQIVTDNWLQNTNIKLCRYEYTPNYISCNKQNLVLCSDLKYILNYPSGDSTSLNDPCYINHDTELCWENFKHKIIIEPGT